VQLLSGVAYEIIFIVQEYDYNRLNTDNLK